MVRFAPMAAPNLEACPLCGMPLEVAGPEDALGFQLSTAVSLVDAPAHAAAAALTHHRSTTDPS
jgi:hypothetical protein